ncbi:MAG: hypothetical protein E5V74_00320 [Mesorhizobium sp.]|nr:MAG: hypothetical protein E5V74_00320 [Mesorhizobium sp.]
MARSAKVARVLTLLVWGRENFRPASMSRATATTGEVSYMSGLHQIAHSDGGIGKSSTSQSTFAAPVELGQQILFVDSEPKTDSSLPILKSQAQDTVLQLAPGGSSMQHLDRDTRSESAAKV